MRTIPILLFLSALVGILFCSKPDKNHKDEQDQPAAIQTQTEDQDFFSIPQDDPCDPGSTIPTELTWSQFRSLVIPGSDGSALLRICSNGKPVFELKDLLLPAEEGVENPLVRTYLGERECLVYFSFSGGASCCFECLVISLDDFGILGQVPTNRSIATIQDVDGDEKNELILHDYQQFQPMPEEPLPPGMVMTVKGDTLVVDSGSTFSRFYTEQTRLYTKELSALSRAECEEANKLGLRMWMSAARRSGDDGLISEARDVAVQSGCFGSEELMRL